MPVTIERLTSNVRIVEGADGLSDGQIERLVALVMARLREQTEARQRSQKESEVPDRMSEHDQF
jgi:hypothetical protein